MVRSAAVRWSGGRTAVVPTCALVLLLGACGGGEGGSAPASTIASDVVPTARADAGILGRRDAAPADVAALLSFTPPAGDFEMCEPAGGPGLGFRPRIAATEQLLPQSDPLEIGRQVLVCAYDVTADGGPATVTVTDAAGRVVLDVSLGLEPTGGGGATWEPELDDSGPHHVVVRQGALTLDADIDVARASSPRLMVLNDDEFKPANVLVGLAGYPAGATVPIAIYRYLDDQSEGVTVAFGFVAEVEVPVNGFGEGIASIPTDLAGGTVGFQFAAARAGITVDRRARGHPELVEFHV